MPSDDLPDVDPDDLADRVIERIRARDDVDERSLLMNIANRTTTRREAIAGFAGGALVGVTGSQLAIAGNDQSGAAGSAASYYVETDGTDIVAVPQQTEAAGVTFSTITGADIGVVLEDIVVDELPPQGDIDEAAGRILLKRGEYPGNLSNGTYDGVPLGTQTVIDGELASHQSTLRRTFSPRRFRRSNSTGRRRRSSRHPRGPTRCK